MSNHVWVRFAVSKYFKKAIENDLGITESKQEGPMPGEVNYFREETSCGDWEELEEYLKEKNISFNKEWGQGDDFEAGSGFFRNGKYWEHSITDQACLSLLKDILKVQDTRKFVENEVKILEPFGEPGKLLIPNSVDYFTKKEK